jgi:hypothetical protein
MKFFMGKYPKTTSGRLALIVLVKAWTQYDCYCFGLQLKPSEMLLRLALGVSSQRLAAIKV